MSNEQMNKAIVVLLDAADEWSNYVDADHAPVSLRKYMEREAEQIISSLPMEVSTSADADAMNITHGESYGSDWVYPTDSSTAPGPAPQGVVATAQAVISAYIRSFGEPWSVSQNPRPFDDEIRRLRTALATAVVQSAPQGVAEMMELIQRYLDAHAWAKTEGEVKEQQKLVEQAITALVTEHDTLRARVAELEKDAARIDWLEAQINENGALHLHDGNDAYGLGLGLQTGRSIRSLRKAIDDASKEAP